MATELGKDVSSSRTAISSKKKVLINGNNQSDVSVAQKVSVMRDEKSIRRNVAIDGNSKVSASDNKHSLDVVSFTFTSPIKKSESGSNSCGFNIAGGHALSMLLEQKLKELSSKIELSQQDLSEAISFSSSANSCENTGLSANFVNFLPDENICKGKQELHNNSNFFPVEKLCFGAEKVDQGVEDIENHKNNSISEHHDYLRLRGAIPVSNQPSFSGATCDSSDTGRTSGMQLSIESYQSMNWSSSRKFHPSDLDIDISDTASSLSVGALSESVTSSLNATDSKDSSYRELQYIMDILGNAEPMFEDFALGQAHKIIIPGLFDQLENQKMGINKFTEDPFMLTRKVLFDCVSECLEFRCRWLLAGSWKIWAKQIRVLNRKQHLAEELYREISSLSNLEELMVDELVDKDMSSRNGKWVSFEIEAFEEGVEIENRILTSLVNELVDDFFC